MIREGCFKIKEEHEELKDQCGSMMEDVELRKLDKGIQQNSLSLQQLLDERIRIWKKSAIVETKVKQLEEEMKKNFLRKKVVLIE